MLTKLLAMVTLATAFGLSGCGSSSIPIKDLRLMNDISDLKLDKSAEPTIVYRRPGAPTLAAYNKFIIDPVRVDYSDTEMKELDPEDVAKMQRLFREKLSKELKAGGYEVGTRSSAGTLRISATISGLKAGGAGGAVNVVASAALGVPGLFSINVGQVTVETAFRNAEANRLDAVAINRAEGSHFIKNKPWSTWADIEDAFENWAVGIRKALDEAHGR